MHVASTWHSLLCAAAACVTACYHGLGSFEKFLRWVVILEHVILGFVLVCTHLLKQGAILHCTSAGVVDKYFRVWTNIQLWLAHTIYRNETLLGVATGANRYYNLRVSTGN